MSAPLQTPRSPVALTEFQTHFSAALLSPDATPISAPSWMQSLHTQPGFAVYRNTVHKACVDALAASFPAVQTLVGEPWFRAAAAIFVQSHPPDDARLVRYGARFSEFLAQFAPAAELPYLAWVAQLERLWTLSHIAVDAPTLDPSALASLPPHALADVQLQPHPAAQWIWNAHAPIHTLWRRNRTARNVDAADAADAENSADQEIDWIGEGVLLTRSHAAVQSTAVDEADCAFMDACASGNCLAAAAESALQVQPDADLSALMSRLLQAGAFSHLSSPS